jgi:hypothetical protein
VPDTLVVLSFMYKAIQARILAKDDKNMIITHPASYI